MFGGDPPAMKGGIIAIVPAAGLGKRFGPDTKKAFHMLLNKPLILWALETLEGIGEIKEIIPVLREEDMEIGVELFERHNLTKIKRVAPGGRERQDSVYSGLRLSRGDADVVLIHDGARPLIEKEMVREAIRHLKGFDGVVVGVPVKDTIKEVEGNTVKRTLRRDEIWAVQTPQVFMYDSLMRAYDDAMAERFYCTDDSALVERSGGRVKIIRGSYSNIKITTPEDIPVAEALLKERMRYEDRYRL